MAFSKFSSLNGRYSPDRGLGGDGHHYDPNQPRVPAGDPDGGQWTSGGGRADARFNSAPTSREMPPGFRAAPARPNEERVAAAGNIAKTSIDINTGIATINR